MIAGRHIRHLNLDFLQCCRINAIWRLHRHIGSERVRRGGDDARRVRRARLRFGKGSRLARRCLVAIGNENGIHRQPHQGSTSSRLPIWRATANATRPQSRAILSELASSSPRRFSRARCMRPRQNRGSAPRSQYLSAQSSRGAGDNQDNVGGLPWDQAYRLIRELHASLQERCCQGNSASIDKRKAIHRRAIARQPKGCTVTGKRDEGNSP